ncbi:MAG: hypothetical protein RSA62_03625 [Oscillospiraceae bacterium]
MALGIIVNNSVNFKPAIIAALTDMDVPLTGTENTDELVAKIKDIIVGDQTVKLFDTAITPTTHASPIAPTSYFETGEKIGLAGLATVTRCNLITSLDAVFVGPGADNVEPVSGCGWVKASETVVDRSTLIYTLPGRATKFNAVDALDKLVFTMAATGTITLTIAAHTSGAEVFNASGATVARFSAANSWLLCENKYKTWTAINGSTWTQIEALRKADYVP